MVAMFSKPAEVSGSLVVVPLRQRHIASLVDFTGPLRGFLQASCARLHRKLRATISVTSRILDCSVQHTFPIGHHGLRESRMQKEQTRENPRVGIPPNAATIRPRRQANGREAPARIRSEH